MASVHCGSWKVCLLLSELAALEFQSLEELQSQTSHQVLSSPCTGCGLQHRLAQIFSAGFPPKARAMLNFMLTKRAQDLPKLWVFRTEASVFAGTHSHTFKTPFCNQDCDSKKHQWDDERSWDAWEHEL